MEQCKVILELQKVKQGLKSGHPCLLNQHIYSLQGLHRKSSRRLYESESESCSVESDSLQPRGLYTVHGILQARILEWVAFPFSRGSFQPRDQNPDLPHCRQILYQLSHKGSPRILQCVAYPFSRGSSWPGNWTWVPCIAGGFFRAGVGIW